MSKKRLLLPAALIAVAAVSSVLMLWPREKEERPARSLCFGSLSEATAELIDDGKGGGVGAYERDKKGEGDLAVFKMCLVSRANPGGGTTRGVYSLIIEDTRSVAGARKGSVPLGVGVTGWATATEAVAQLPAGCARRMGSTAPYITVTLSAPSQAEKHGTVDRDTAVRNSVALVSESAGNLARTQGC